jgi:hypothetical protein
MPLSRYPRPGQPIAPQPLREFLKSERVTRFDHLDAAAWRRLGEQACRELAEQFLDELIRRTPRVFDKLAGHRLSSQGGPVALDDLELQPRTRNCFARAGISELPDFSNGLTVAEISQLRGFGVACLVDLMASLEANGTKRPRPRRASNNHRTVAEGAPVSRNDLPPAIREVISGVGSVPGALAVTRSDPRLGPQTSRDCFARYIPGGGSRIVPPRRALT